MTFLREQRCNLVSRSPMVRCEGEGLGEETDGWWHCILFRMAQLGWADVWEVHGQVLIEVDGVEHRHELHSYQHLVFIIWFGFATRCSVASEPLQERLVCFGCRTLQIHLVSSVCGGLTGEGGTKQEGHLI